MCALMLELVSLCYLICRIYIRDIQCHVQPLHKWLYTIVRFQTAACNLHIYVSLEIFRLLQSIRKAVLETTIVAVVDGLTTVIEVDILVEVMVAAATTETAATEAETTITGVEVSPTLAWLQIIF